MAICSKIAEKKLGKPSARVSHIFKRNDFYYFRFALPKTFKARMGNEICLSLRTPIRREALKL
jgi:hypothetical protein